MNGYVDKICDPKTTPQGREFLKSKLRDDYMDFKDAINQHVHKVAENTPGLDDSYEQDFDASFVKDLMSKFFNKLEPKERMVLKMKFVDDGSISGISRQLGIDEDTIRQILDKGMRHLRRLERDYPLKEAVHRVPLTTDDFEAVKRLMEKPIPAIVAPIYISEVIEDDAFTDELNSLAETDPGRDVRQLIVDWIDRVMPDQKHRFGQEVGDMDQRKGVFSPLHGYDPHYYKGSTDTGNGTSGNAYGRV